MSRTPAVPGYTLVDRMHRGPHADVWRAVRDADGRPVAVKIPAPGPDGADVVAESVLLRAARHDHLLGVLDEVYLADGRAALVTDLADGGSLADLVAARGHLTASEACAVLAPVADALWSLHRQDVVHGDVSPANVLLTDQARPLLADLGSAASRRAVTGVWGTEGFVAPEVLAGGDPTAASDVFSLGAVLVHALTGQGVSPLEQVDRVVRRCTDAADLPDGLEDALRAALAGDPGARPRSIEVARSLAGVATPEAIDVGGRRESDLVTYRVRPPRAAARPVAHRATRRPSVRVPERVPVRGLAAAGAVVAVAAAGWALAPSVTVVARAAGLGGSPPPATAAPASPGTTPATATGPARGATPGTAPGTAAGGGAGDPAARHSGASSDPRAVLAALLARRAQAFAARDAAALDAVDLPGSWARQRDAAIVAELAARGETQHGLAFTVPSARVVSAASARTMVEAVVAVSPYRSTRAGVTQAVAARSLAPQRYVLAWSGERWLIERVEAAPRPS